MEPGRWGRITDIYHATIARPPEERASFLGEECHGDESLRKQVEAMVKSHERSGDFIESPAFAVAPELLIESAGDLIGQLIGHYRIESLLGVGGMGEVYLARDELLGRKVALKLPPEHLTEDETQVSRFKTEARTASALNHPNILTVHEIGAEGNRHFIATEFIEGITLRALLRRGRMNLHDALEIAVQVASALAAAHDTGVVHRDIKPENIMLRPDGYAKVLDFGIAKLTEPELGAADRHAGTTTLLLQTRAGLVMGTAQYMSPEQARGQTADARSDIWSLGVVLYEMVAGNPPFSDATPSDYIASILKTEPPPLSSALPDVPVKLQSIMHKALRKNRDERYQTIKEMLADLRELKAELDRESSLPQIKGRVESVVSKIKHHKRAVLLASSAAVLAAATIAYFFYFVAPVPPGDGKSIAVLPFVDLSQTHDQEYLCDGIQEEILNRLSKIADLKVISRTSTQRYKSAREKLPAMARQLGTAHILEGTVQRVEDQVRIHVQLIDARNDSHLWAEKYDRKLTDVFGVESEIAKAIADSLGAKLSGLEQRAIATRPTESAAAHQLYLKGTYFSNKRTGADLRTATEYFKAAIGRDPKYAAAYAGLADAYTLLSLWGGESPANSMPQAKAAARKAIELDETLPEAHNSLGLVLALHDFDFAQSKKEFERAIELNPNFATAHHQFGNVNLAMIGEFDRAIAEGNRAVELDPLSLIINADLGQDFMLARRYDEAIEQLHKTLAMDPRFYYARWTLGECLQMKGQLSEAIAEYQKAAEISDDPTVVALLAQGYAKTGQRDKASGLLSQLEQLATQRYVGPFTFALVHLALDENEKAIDDLERANRERVDPAIVGIKVEPLLDPLRGHPRFERLLAEVVGNAENKSPTQLIEDKSIAVLPFENLSDDKANSYFTSGIQEEILTQLAKIGTLKVISRTSTQHYESAPRNLSEVAKELGVANLLEGSVQKAGKQVRVHAQLIRAQDGSHLWAETYDRNLNDIFSVESEVATAIAQKLQAKLTGSEERALKSKPTGNLDAYDAYLRGLEFDRRTETLADLLEAKRYLGLAVKLDPTFALAWARLGKVEANIYFQDIDIHPAPLDAARNAVETAVRLQPDLGESWLASGYYHLYCDRNRKLARAAFEKARQRLPNDSDVLFALSIVDRSQGQPDNALALQTEALRLDPRNASLFFQQGETFAALRRFDEARAAADNALMITPNDRELVAFKAITYQAEGDLARAHQTFGEYSSQPWNARAYSWQLRQLMLERNYADMIPRLRPLLAERAPSTAINQDTYYWLLGMAQKLTGDLKGAQSTFAQGCDFLLETIQKSGGPQGAIHATIAMMYAGVGDKPNAIREANRGIELEGDDTYYAPAAEEVLAIIEAQTGETASAVARLPKLLKSHYFSWLSYAPLTPALLRIDPVWDPLRDDPLFQKLINEGKP
jgi:TolB-like protein/Tfp pilus assembly protein PilF